MTTRGLVADACDTAGIAHPTGFPGRRTSLGLQPRMPRRAVHARPEILPHVNEECIHEPAFPRSRPAIFAVFAGNCQRRPVTHRNPWPPVARRTKEGGSFAVKGAAANPALHTSAIHPGGAYQLRRGLGGRKAAAWCRNLSQLRHQALSLAPASQGGTRLRYFTPNTATHPCAQLTPLRL